MQTQKQRSIGSKGQETRPPPATSTNIRSSGDDQENGRSDVFMQEDDVAYWLHCPVDDNSLESCLQYNHGLPYPVSTPVTVSPTCLPPPLPELHASDKPPPAVISVGEKGRGGGGEVAGKEIEAREMSVSVTSSPGSSGSMEPPSPTDRMEYDTKFHNNEDIDFGYADVKKQSHGGSTSTKRSRSTEIHNLSERGGRKMTVDEGGDERRRDRINEKMKTLQELIPRCNKSDKASILDEAIEYLKSLQMQVQMMSTGCSMVPMMFLRPQQYMLPMAMGTNPLVFPYLAIPPGPSMPNPSAAAHLSQQFPVPGFNMTPVTVAGPVANPMMSSFTPNSQNQPQLLTFVDPFQQYHSLGQTELPLPQNQGVMPPIASKPSSFKASPNQ